LQHLAVANTYYPADSDTMIANQMAKANLGQRGGLYLNQMVTKQDQGQAKYYGQASDPYYVFTTCRRNSGDNIAPEHNAIGFPFHAPSGAMPNLTDGTDHTIRIWDQTTNTIISSYAPSSAFPACPGNTGHAGTYSDPCPLADGSGGNLSGYVGCTKFAWNEPVPYGPSGDGWGTNGVYPMSGMVRFQEILQGHIYHMVYLDLNCSSGSPVVFPNSTGYTAHVCATPATGIPNGALIFLDYNDAQLADMCPAPICATAGPHALPRWQYPFIEALSKYGGYFGDTMGDNSVQGITPARLESEAAYVLAGIPTPAPAGYADFFQWLASQPHTNCILVNGGYKCPAPIFENVPPESNNVGGSGTDIFSHMHVADQCVAKTLAGVAGGC
jgi:hypothetical protein